MAKLNTTVENIQLDSRMLRSSDTDRTWNDYYYPSAAAVDARISTTSSKLEHPVGSIIITNTATNPGATAAGTWELVDKDFKNGYVDITRNWTQTVPGYVAAGAATLSWGKMMRNGHTIFLQLWLVTSTDNGFISLNPDSDINLGILSRAACGLDETKQEGSFIISAERDIAMAVTPEYTSQAGTTVKTNYYPVCINFRGDGLFSIAGTTVSAGGGLSLPDGTLICVSTAVQADWRGMLDSACDKFYWKRTA